MSDYEATAYLSLEKLKVSKGKLTVSGETHARVPVVPRQSEKGAVTTGQILTRLD